MDPTSPKTHYRPQARGEQEYRDCHAHLEFDLYILMLSHICAYFHLCIWYMYIYIYIHAPFSHEASGGVCERERPWVGPSPGGGRCEPGQGPVLAARPFVSAGRVAGSPWSRFLACGYEYVVYFPLLVLKGIYHYWTYFIFAGDLSKRRF